MPARKSRDIGGRRTEGRRRRGTEGDGSARICYLSSIIRPPPPLVPRNVLVPLIVACALFMQNTDSTVISTALPVIAKSIGEDPIALKLALTSYLVSLAVFIP